MDINLLVKVTARAWALPILAKLHSGVPGRQAALLAATGAGRTSFAASLNHLLELGLLERNPGHGHPMRPEFRLTNTGHALGPRAAKVMTLVPDQDALAVLRKSWTVPVLTVTRRPMRFSQIRTVLPGVTDRALVQSLDQLQARDWMSREMDLSARLPRPIYVARAEGLQIAKAMGGPT